MPEQEADSQGDSHANRPTCGRRAAEFPILIIFLPRIVRKSKEKYFLCISCLHPLISPSFFSPCITITKEKILSLHNLPLSPHFTIFFFPVLQLIPGSFKSSHREVFCPYRDKGRNERHLSWGRDGGTWPNLTRFLENSIVVLITQFSPHRPCTRRYRFPATLKQRLAVSLKLAATCSFSWNSGEKKVPMKYQISVTFNFFSQKHLNSLYWEVQACWGQKNVTSRNEKF